MTACLSCLVDAEKPSLVAMTETATGPTATGGAFSIGIFAALAIEVGAVFGKKLDQLRQRKQEERPCAMEAV